MSYVTTVVFRSDDFPEIRLKDQKIRPNKTIFHVFDFLYFRTNKSFKIVFQKI
jgi:hypothetical protein